jgi:hypothetical protein
VADPGAPTERFQRVHQEPKTIGMARQQALPDGVYSMQRVEPPPTLAVNEDTGLMRLARTVAQMTVILACLCFAALCVLGTWRLVTLLGLPW